MKDIVSGQVIVIFLTQSSMMPDVLHANVLFEFSQLYFVIGIIIPFTDKETQYLKFWEFR